MQTVSYTHLDVYKRQPFTLLPLLMDALRHGMQFINQGGFVETKSGAVHHFQDVAAAERRRIELPETIKVGQRPALAIFQHDGFAQRRLCLLYTS